MPSKKECLFLTKPLYGSGLEAPDLATVKDFLRFHAVASKGKIKEKITTDSLNTFALLLPAAQLWPRRSQAAVPKCEDQVLVGQVPKCPAALDKVLPCRCHNGTWQTKMYGPDRLPNPESIVISCHVIQAMTLQTTNCHKCI